MYDNIGGKIKGLVKTIFVLESIGFIILGLSMLDASVLLGLIVLIIGPLIAWVSSFVLYGFGELVEKISQIEVNTRNGYNIAKTNVPPKKTVVGNRGLVNKSNGDSNGEIIEREFQNTDYTRPPM